MSQQPDPDAVREARNALDNRLSELDEYCTSGTPSTLRKIMRLEQDPRYHQEALHRWKVRTTATIREYVSDGEADKFAEIGSLRSDVGLSATSISQFADSQAALLRALIDDIIEHEMPAFFSTDSGSPTASQPDSEPDRPPNEVFVVHGRDKAAMESVARTLERLKLKATILHEEPNKGRSILQKFMDHANVRFAVVLITADDVGRLSTDDESRAKPRARQNVVFELGYFVGCIGPQGVCVLYQDGVEMPSDYEGVAYIKLGSDDSWKGSLVKELRTARFEVNANLLF